ncbi:MAG: hypothetical protein JWL76_605 [Thermoleophilia bacterium]|nr:hypothetical protein [Thermoleophilia bacterium]
MDDAPATPASDPVDLDPTTAAPRDLMRALLPPARAEYIKAWEFLADASTTLERRRIARERAKTIADDHSVVAAFLREREKSLAGDDLLNARHLADELERHVDALGKLATVSPIGLLESKTLRPEALGCGKRYRVPSASADAGGGTRGVSDKPKSSPRDAHGRGGRDDRPQTPRGPKVDKGALGSSKHDSQVADDLDPETRAKLEAMKAALEGN